MKQQKDLQKSYPNVKFEYEWFDFTFNKSYKDYEQLNRKFKDYDISILINNAGLLEHQYFLSVWWESAEDMLYVNALAPLLITREFIDRLRSWKYRSAIINVSSSGGMTPMPKISYYGASKAYLRSLSLALY